MVCTGVKLDWGKVGGLSEAVGRGGVCSNYSPDHVNYTWECLKALKPGSKAVFTQPPLPFKCPGAPQKIVYLTADHLQRRGILPDEVNYQHNLVAVDAKAKTAIFEIAGGDKQGQRIEVPYDMLHVSPPQSPSDDAITLSDLDQLAGEKWHAENHWRVDKILNIDGVKSTVE